MLLFHCSSVETFVSRDNSLLKLDDHYRSMEAALLLTTP
uniref:Bm774 n=1 Tax=Brugia malayi TaxID=6279 RepID=A0A1U7F2E9_BRUMA